MKVPFLDRKDKMGKAYIKSDYTEKLISETQSLAEKIVVKHAKSKGINLPWKFWDNPDYVKWGKKFIAQAKKASELLKKYKYEVIVEAINDKECRNIESLGALYKIIPVCDEIVKKRDALSKVEGPNIREVDVNEKPRPLVGKKTMFSKLKSNG